MNQNLMKFAVFATIFASCVALYSAMPNAVKVQGYTDATRKSLHIYIAIALYIQWSLRIKDTLGAGRMSFIERLSSGGRFESLL